MAPVHPCQPHVLCDQKHGGVIGVYAACDAVSNNFNNLFHRRALSLDQIKEATAPLSVFVSTFPDAKSIEGSEYLFRAHPEIEGAHGINDAGTKVINNLVRCFFIRKVDIGRLVWSGTWKR